MSVFEVVGYVQTCAGTTFELLESIALVERAGTHIGVVKLIHHRGITETQTQVEVRDYFRFWVLQALLIFLVVAFGFLFFSLLFRRFANLRFLTFLRYFSAFVCCFVAFSLLLGVFFGRRGFLFVRLAFLGFSSLLFLALRFYFRLLFLAFLRFFCFLRSSFLPVRLGCRNRLRHCIHR